MQTKLAAIASVEQVTGPAYIRFGREPVPDFTDEQQEFIVGKGQVLNDGNDVTIIATGHLTWEALEAAKTLAKSGIQARVINIHTIKPLDDNLIIKAAEETGAIVTAEEHQVTGGLGGAVAELLARQHPVPIEFIGMPDCFGESGKPEELMKKYGMKSDHITAAVNKVIKRSM
jgi:transketolase